jgi:hypothetical protein
MKAEIKEQLLKLTLQDIVELVQEKKMVESKAIHPNDRRTLGKVEVVIRAVECVRPSKPESKYVAEFEIVLPGDNVLMRIDKVFSNDRENVEKCIKELNDIINKYQK